MHSSRWASLIRSTWAGVMESRSVMPRLAVITDAVVEAMPFWVNTALYGPAGPVIRCRSVSRMCSANSVPV